VRETEATRLDSWTISVIAPSLPRRFRAVLASLLIAAAGCGGVRRAAAAEVLELRFNDLQIPIDLAELERWTLRPRRAVNSDDDLGHWLALLDSSSHDDVVRLLRAPLVRDQSFGRQLLDTWTGTQMMSALGNLLTSPDGDSTTALLQSTLRRELDRRPEVNAIQLLRALPLPRVSLRLGGLMELAERWRRQLAQQRRAVEMLPALGLPEHRSRPLAFSTAAAAASPHRRTLAVPHRARPLPLVIREGAPPARGNGPPPWVLLLPGLGGDADQLGWLAEVLAAYGWSSVVLQHPDSDAAAMKASLDGERLPPGAETLALRLADVEATLAAQRQGRLPVRGDGVVFMGHSLGGVTALLAAGLEPERGLAQRCSRGRDHLPITNPSLLLQCELPSVGVPDALAPPADLRGLVLFNSFGSLLWPHQGLGPLRLPVLMVSGSLDLVTPPLQEQLALFLAPGDPRSRLVLVEGGSHFSPVRMTASEQAVFKLGRELVGEDPPRVQALLLRLTTEFLQGLEQPITLPPQRHSLAGVRAYVLDGPTAHRWQALQRR
jgi:predicted dienelactone hydrolase